MGGAFFRIEKPLPHYTAGALQNVDHLWTVDGARRTTSAPRRLTCWLGSSLEARTVHHVKYLRGRLLALWHGNRGLYGKSYLVCSS